ncbi:MAG: aldo/keto reductase [Deltaproteobacteria bacterium]|nr:aldo/keto reductase [Deltaproteobacteria bacterium]
MQTITLGATDIQISRLGIGTGTALPSGHCAQSRMSPRDLANLLIYGHEQGITFWDTAVQYGTYPHIRIALQNINRQKVVICTKFIATTEQEIMRLFESSLQKLSTDHIDICLLHAIRSEQELEKSQGALNALVSLKKAGHIRAIGLSSHGLSTLRCVPRFPEIDVVWARLNYAGLIMDTARQGIFDRLASIQIFKKYARLLPKRLLGCIRPWQQGHALTVPDHQNVTEALQAIHSRGTGIVAMKVFGEGRLRSDPEKALHYITSLPWVHACIAGMLSKHEIDQNIQLVNSPPP